MCSKLTLKVVGEDENIFAIMSRARRVLVENGQSDNAKIMLSRVTSAKSYEEALSIIGEYVILH